MRINAARQPRPERSAHPQTFATLAWLTFINQLKRNVDAPKNTRITSRVRQH
jgi:hypothetical protein